MPVICLLQVEALSIIANFKGESFFVAPDMADHPVCFCMLGHIAQAFPEGKQYLSSEIKIQILFRDFAHAELVFQPAENRWHQLAHVIYHFGAR